MLALSRDAHECAAEADQVADAMRRLVVEALYATSWHAVGPQERMPSTEARRDGVDLARWIAFVGMVLVNFRIVMGAEGGAPWLVAAVDALSGRAAALFVILAGFGLGKTAVRATRATVLKRALFLFAVGLLNALVFDADILHFYGVYFAIGALVMRWHTAALATFALGAVAASAWMIVELDYDQGWDWGTLTYVDLWTAEGMLRHLFYNGWHPVLPWFAFLLLGVALSRCDWRTPRARLLLLGAGVAVAAVTQWSAAAFVAAMTPKWGSELAAAVFGTGPIPPMPFYLFAAAGSAVAVLAVCMIAADAAPRVTAVFAPAGRQTLTLYLAHILIGMTIIDALGMTSASSVEQAVAMSLCFCAVGTLLAWLWARRFARGPVEWLMRRLAG